MTERGASSKLYFDANVFMLSFNQALRLPEGMRRVTRDGLPQLIEELS
jgi:hypothetical protein